MGMGVEDGGWGMGEGEGEVDGGVVLMISVVLCWYSLLRGITALH